MTSQVVQGQAILREITEYCTLEGDIDHDEASFDYFRSELTCMTPPPPFGQGQVKVKIKGKPVT